MENSDIQSAIRHAHVSGHSIRSVVSANEPERHRHRALSDLQSALPLASSVAAVGGEVKAVVTTPDFHAGKPVPVGVVVDSEGVVMPHLIGNDIGCGMRMIALEGVSEDDLRPNLDQHLRHMHFQGGRNIVLSGRHRHAILREGVPGLLTELETQRHGLLSTIDGVQLERCRPHV